MERLPVPRPDPKPVDFRNIVTLTARVCATPSDVGSTTKLQASVAKLYELTSSEFQHVLDTFPLIPTNYREATLHSFEH
jgi:hypothetical protein